MSNHITASHLYNLVQCPHRVFLDDYGDYSQKDPVSPFVHLLWEKGNRYEQDVVDGLDISYTDLSQFSDRDKEEETLKAIKRGDALIYSGRIKTNGLLGIPDLLRKKDNGYAAGDIKSGAGLEGANDLEDGKPKKHYAVQLALYTDILETLNLSAGRNPFVWDVHGQEIVYDLNVSMGKRTPKTWWSFYQETLQTARSIKKRECRTLPAFSSDCKMCQWYSHCKEQVIKSNDLTLIPDLGRSRRETLSSHFNSMKELADADIESLIQNGKTPFHQIGPASLQKYQNRARLLMSDDPKPYAVESIDLPDTDLELFFDIETDPMRDICYLHGFVERTNRDNSSEEYFAFLADAPTQKEEKMAFAAAWEFMQSRPGAAIYYYSHYEKTYYSKLQKLYPDVVSEQQLQAFFESDLVVDLYTDVVKKKTEWPTYNYSIKTLAKYLGFQWRDTDPSGASSIEWYHRWTEDGDDEVKQRILDYNEDDCVATRVLVEGVRGLESD
jgi:predicted RecB family nuclease